MRSASPPRPDPRTMPTAGLRPAVRAVTSCAALRASSLTAMLLSRNLLVADGNRIRLPRGALARLSAADPALCDVIARVPFAMRHGAAESHLAALVRSIVYQQLSGKAAATIYGRFRALFPAERFPEAEHILALHHTRLRKAGLSRQKSAALRD